MNVVLVADRACIHPANGGDLRIWNLLQGNADHIYFASADQTVAEDARGAMGWRTIERIPVVEADFRIPRGGEDPSNFLARMDDAGAELRRRLGALARERGPLTLVVHGHRSGMMLGWGVVAPFAFDGGDCASLFHQRRAASLGWRHPLKAANSLAWARTFREIESGLSERVPLFLLPSEADAAAVRAHSPQARIVVLGNGTGYLSQQPVVRSADPVIGFVGGMTWEPNVTAACHLARDVMPHVLREVAAARLRIAGGPVGEELRAVGSLPGVECKGHVADVPSFLSTCAVFAAPMLHGAGVKNKIIEAMALGMPVATNSLGAEALSARARDAVVVADGAQPLARAIVGLLKDPARRDDFAKRARAVAEAEFPWEDLAAKFRAELERIPTESFA